LALPAFFLVLCLTPVPCPAQADGEDVVIGTYRQVPSGILGEERRILVHLPRGYEESDRSYPVIYKLHGAPLSFFAPIASSLDLLAESGRIPQAILVGVEQDGHWEVRPRAVDGPPLHIRAEEFRQFLTQELLPFVDRNYRTKDLRILMGTFDCGLFAVHTLLEAPESFHAYLANSPHDFRPGAEAVLGPAVTRLAEGLASPRFLFVTDWRNAEGETDPLVDDFLAGLDRATPRGLTWGSQVLDHPAHNTWLPYRVVEFGLLAFFDGYKCPPEVVDQGLAGVEAHYAALSRRFGVQFEIPEMTFNNLSDHLMARQRWEEAIEVLLLFREVFPRSLNAVFRQARAYRGAGDLAHAVECYRGALEFGNCPSSLVEVELNRLGYDFLYRGQAADAVAVFQKNVDAFPASPNVHDSLAEGYVHLFDREQAITSYRRALELDPENETTRWNLGKVDQSIADLRGETEARLAYPPGENTGLKGEYFGQEPPGLTGEVFAPGIISTHRAFEFGPTFSPDGKEMYFRRRGMGGGFLVCRREENGWTAPEPVPDLPEAFEPHITPDGKRMFFGRGPEIWVMDRSGDGWGEPVLHGPGMFATTTREGTLYFTDITEPWNPSLVRQRLVDGAYTAPEKISETMNGPDFGAHPCIARDESYLLFDSRPVDEEFGDADIYVCFRRADGNWDEPILLGDEINTDGENICLSISPDGKYLFYTSRWDIYWVSAEILEKYRPDPGLYPAGEYGFTDYQEMRARFGELFTAEKFAEAAELLEWALERFPDNLVANSYNLALTYCRLERPADAIVPLQYALDRGVWFSSYAFLHETWDPVRQLEQYAEIDAANEALRQKAQAEARPELVVKTPAGYDSERTYPLFIALHGGNGNIAEFQEVWTSQKMQDGFIVAYLQSSQVCVV